MEVVSAFNRRGESMNVEVSCDGVVSAFDSRGNPCYVFGSQLKRVMDAVASITDPKERQNVQRFIIARVNLLTEIRAGAGHPATDHGTGMWLVRVIAQCEDASR